MPYVSPADVSDGNVAPASWGDSVKAATDYLASPPACRVYRTTTQSINNNTLTAVTFDAERFDTDTMHSTVTNTGRITFTTAGIYVVSFSGGLAAASDYTLVEMMIRKNGSSILANSTMGTWANATDGPQCATTTIYKFAAADYVEALVFHVNSGAAARNLTASGTGAAQYCDFSAAWIGTG